MKHLSKLFLLALMALSLAACGNPRGAAIEREVTKEAAAPDADIAVYPVTRAFLPSVAQWPNTGECAMAGSVLAEDRPPRSSAPVIGYILFGTAATTRC